MGIIQVLSETVANKIAAGEVIERPASIIKELIENSLDAGATQIEVEIKNGGKSLIRVADNGSGMTADDAELAFQRHATSKIKTAEDLDHIFSFGFRGEALPSIAAVSRVRLLTRVKNQADGTEIVYEGGRLIEAKPAACREGTVIEVRDLFFNTPARRKFVKTDSTESGHIQDTVCYLALANIHVHFKLITGGKTLLDLLPVEHLIERVSVLWGPDQEKHLIKIQGEGGDFQVHGIIGKPFLARANRSNQIYFVNRRWIRSIALSYALQDGYHGLLMHGQYPCGVIFIEANPERVDVNVHPTKQEIRISKESEVKSLIRRIVSEALQKEGDIAPALKMPAGLPGDFSSFNSRTSLSDYLPLPAKNSAMQLDEGRFAEPSMEYGVISEKNLEEAIVVRDHLHLTKILGQVHNTFILAETQEGFIVVDQHAAHERIMFEVMLAELQTGAVRSQKLLMEETLEIHPKQWELYESAREFLHKIGFETEPFGENAIVLRAFPAALEKEDPAACLKRFLEQLEEGHLKPDLEHYQEEIAALIACKRKSVKAHDPMPDESVRHLLVRLARCENPYNCPHGRPTFFKHTFLDLERQFKRK